VKATAITEHVTQLTRFGAVNAFLVKEPDGLTLVDTMIKGSQGRLLEAARETGSPVVRIVVTHAHDDHVGSLVALAQLLPEAEIIAPRRDARLMRGDKTLDPDEPKGRLFGGYPPLDVTIDREVLEGERIGSLEVVDAPGHTPGQIALLDPRGNVLIAGDAYSTLGGVATTAGPYWRMPLPGFATWHRPTALESARKLKALRPEVLAVGHGKPVRNPVPAMESAIDKRA
jgi:glyoxylase-like metal-dependent hydrolase (beta-lactamase superfamily II)